MSIKDKKKLTLSQIDAEILDCFKRYGVVTSIYIADQLEVTRQQVSARLRLLAEAGEAHVAYTSPEPHRYQVWASGELDEAAIPNLRLKLLALQAMPALRRAALKIPATSYKTTFVNGVSPWSKRAE